MPHETQNESLFARVRITLGIRNRIVGGVPTDPELIKGWIAANMPKVEQAEREKLAQKTTEELGAAAEAQAEGMWTTFKRDAGAIYIESRAVKACFKEAANILRDMLTKREGRADGKKSRYTNLKSRLAERLFIEEEKIPLMRGGVRVKDPDGNQERVLHVMTAQGPRSALKRFDYVSAPATITFTARYLRDGVVDPELLRTLLDFASWNGLGADRAQGDGLFEVVELQPLD